MTTLVVDLECNGLYDTVTKIHCIVAKDVDTKEIRKFHGGSPYGISPVRMDTVDSGISYLLLADKIIGHNFIDFDMRVIEKLHGVKLDVDKIIDTYLLSCMLNPDRQRVKGCKKGAHSLEAWGIRLGKGKPSHEDWTVFSQEMLHRCTEDVLITELVAQNLGVL